MGERTIRAHDLARPGHVGAEPALAAEQPRVFLTGHPRPDDAPHPGAQVGHDGSRPAARCHRDRAVASTASTMP